MTTLGALLPGLYATVQDRGQWMPVLDGLCDLAGTRSAAMQIFVRDGGFLRPIVTARDSFSLMHAEAHDRHVNNDANPRLKLRHEPWLSQPIVRDHDRLDNSDAEFKDLRARLAMIGLGSAISVNFDLAPDLKVSLILHRSVEDARGFDEREEAMLHEMMPHLRQATELSMKLSEAHAAVRSMQSAVDAVRLGILLCDAGGRVRWINRSARATIDRSTLLSVRNDRLRLSDLPAERRLREMLSAVASGDRWPVMALERGCETLQMQIAPLGRDDGPHHDRQALRAIFLSDRAAPLDISPDHVAELFSLSPAEARLAAAIARGASVSSYSEMRGISIGTARIQLKQVLAKTQAGKQADLTRQLCGSVMAQTVAPTH